MFCPKCGSEISENAAFCPKCGHNVGKRQQNLSAPAQPQQHELPGQAPQTQYEPPMPPAPTYNQPSGVPVGPPPQQAPTKKKKPVALIAILMVVLIGGGVFAALRISSCMRAGKFEEPELKEAEPGRVSPEQNIEVVEQRLELDAVSRYVITGKVRNTGDKAYDVKLKLTAVKHADDKYEEETTETQSVGNLVSTTPYTRTDGSSVTLYDLEPGEREFVVYPSSSDWGNPEVEFSDVECTVDKVTMPDAQSRTRFDHNFNSEGGIRDIKIDYTADGKLTGSFVNGTDLYLNEVEIEYVLTNASGLPAVEYTNGGRPYGAKVGTIRVETLKPGATGEFEISVGEGYTTANPIDVRITPDPNKSTFN